MNRLFCDVCKRVTRCKYCSRYGPFGVYMYLENESLKKKNDRRKYRIEVPSVDITKRQIFMYSKVKG